MVRQLTRSDLFMTSETRKTARIAWYSRVFERLGDAMDNGKLRVIRDVTRTECDWLEEDIPKDTIVFSHRHTYGLISHNGWGVTKEPGVAPFFELPLDALEAVITDNKTST